MKRFAALSLLLGMIISTLVFTGCGKPAMPPIKYAKPIDCHVNKNAVLCWDYGKEHKAKIKSNENANQNKDIIGMLLSTATKSIDLNNNPNRFFVSYGQSDQAAFMTSLKDVLSQNEVFKNVAMVNEERKNSPNDALINVFFKKTRVCESERNYGITLTVELTITTAGKPDFTRTYLVKSDPEVSGFIRQKTDVSARLMDKLMNGIQEWRSLNRVS